MFSIEEARVLLRKLDNHENVGFGLSQLTPEEVQVIVDKLPEETPLKEEIQAYLTSNKYTMLLLTPTEMTQIKQCLDESESLSADSIISEKLVLTLTGNLEPLLELCIMSTLEDFYRSKSNFSDNSLKEEEEKKAVDNSVASDDPLSSNIMPKLEELDLAEVVFDALKAGKERFSLFIQYLLDRSYLYEKKNEAIQTFIQEHVAIIRNRQFSYAL